MTAARTLSNATTGPAHAAGFVQVVDGYLPRQTCADMYAALALNEIPSSLFYVSLDLLSDQGRALIGQYLPGSTASFLVDHLQRLLEVIPADLARRGHGFEIWTTRSFRTGHNGCYLHIDNDEWLRTTRNVIRAPLAGSVLHLGPDKGLEGGETMFADEEILCGTFPPFQFHDWDALVASPGVQVVPQQAGRLVVFDGRMAHGRGPVIDHPADRPRVTLLANLWDGRIGDVPVGLCPLSPDAYHLWRTGLPQSGGV